jgi:Flp pilus assembly protein TadD
VAAARDLPCDVDRLVNTLVRCASARFENGDFEGARIRFEEALALRPGRRFILHNYGTFEIAAGNLERAQELLDERLHGPPRWSR